MNHFAIQQAFLKTCLVNLMFKAIHLIFSMNMYKMFRVPLQKLSSFIMFRKRTYAYVYPQYIEDIINNVSPPTAYRVSIRLH